MLSPFIVSLVGLSSTDCTLLQDAGIFTDDDLSLLKKSDIGKYIFSPRRIPTATTTITQPTSLAILKRRKLLSIAKYLRFGNTVTETTTLKDVNRSLLTAKREKKHPLTTPRCTPTTVGNGNMMCPSSTTSSSSSRPIEATTCDSLFATLLPKFSGHPWDMKEWERRVLQILGHPTTPYFTLLLSSTTNNAAVCDDGDTERKKRRNMELYWMVFHAVEGGLAEPILFRRVSSARDIHHYFYQDGRAAWKALQTWYRSDATKHALHNHCKAQLDAARLDTSTTPHAMNASEYVDTFVKCYSLLGNYYNPATQKAKFLQQIVDSRYETVRQACYHDSNLLFKGCTFLILAREDQLRMEVELNTFGYRSEERSGTSIVTAPDLVESSPTYEGGMSIHSDATNTASTVDTASGGASTMRTSTSTAVVKEAATPTQPNGDGNRGYWAESNSSSSSQQQQQRIPLSSKKKRARQNRDDCDNDGNCTNGSVNVVQQQKKRKKKNKNKKKGKQKKDTIPSNEHSSGNQNGAGNKSTPPKRKKSKAKPVQKQKSKGGSKVPQPKKKRKVGKDDSVADGPKQKMTGKQKARMTCSNVSSGKQGKGRRNTNQPKKQVTAKKAKPSGKTKK